MQSPRILIADDQPHILEALQLLLKTEGFAIEAVNSPEAVLAAVQEKSFDVLLLDMNYARDTTSGREGLQLLSRIREFDNALPVVFMTAWGSVELAVEAMQDGGRDFLLKPWDNGRLLGALRRQINEGRLLREAKKEIEDAREIQRRLLPSEMPKFSNCQVRAFWRPAREVGGDYFDAIRLTDSLAAFCIADVAGKGLPAALLMSHLQASVRGLAQTTRSPSEMCRQLNRVALENTKSDRFTTFFYGILDSTRGSLRYSNAGHVPPILLRRNGTIVRPSEGGTVLGLFPDAEYKETEISFAAGDRLVLMTDGITEATNSRDEEFGENRLIRLLVERPELGDAELQLEIVEAVTSFAGRSLQDDATLMIVSMR
jgi:sigma-B regulation protein RsbU (phosphoserine phosphatase)